MDELEGKSDSSVDNTPVEKSVNTESSTASNLEDIPIPSDPQKKGSIIKSVLTKKSEFKEFVRFVKNGFKLK